MGPGESDDRVTPGAKRSVLRVERALRKKGLLARSAVDGHFGSSTISAYAAWQRSLGYSGLAATGLPGERRSSSSAAAASRSVGSSARARTRRTVASSSTCAPKRMLTAAAHLLKPGCTLVLSQGSYNPGGVDPSAGTHDGGGAADISIGHRCGRRIPFVVRALRRVGFAAWHRLPSQGPWEEHIHAVAVSDPDLAGGAQHQVGDYYEGRNGLASGAPDDGPQIPKRTWEDYKRAH